MVSIRCLKIFRSVAYRPASKSSMTCAVLLAASVALLAPSAANAGFTRKFEGDITGTCPVLGETQQAGVCEPSDAKVTRFDPTGIAVDGSEELVVADDSASLAKFGPAPSSAFQGLLPLEGSAGAEGVAAERSMPAGNGEFYVTHGNEVEAFEADGKHPESWGGFTDPRVVVDNSTDMSDPSACGTMPLSPEECTLYVVAEEGVAEQRVLEKFNSKHKPEDFSALGSNELTLGGSGPNNGDIGASVAVDAEGDIYAFGDRAVGVFAPSGEALAESFSVDRPEVPLVEGEAGEIKGVAVDPVSGHLLVSVNNGSVDEFDLATGRFVAQLTATGEGGHLRNPGAIGVDSKGDVYVMDPNSGAVDVWGPGAYHPTVTLGVAGERAAGGAVLSGSVDPAQGENESPAPLVECSFQYVEEAKYEEALAKREAEGFVKGVAASEPCEHPDAAEVQSKYEEAPGAYPVHAAIKGLKPGKTYRYRLVAETEKTDNGGIGVSEEARAFTEPAEPVILSSSVTGVSLTFAELHATINPLGADTSYRFEYLSAAAFAADGGSFAGPDPATSVPVPSGTIGAGGPTGGAVESVLQDLSELTPGTEYHFRVVAANAVGVKYGPDRSFVTEPEVVRGAPDGRSYELVTPAERVGGSDLFAEPEVNGVFENEEDLGLPAESGEAFLLTTEDGFGSFPFAGGQAYVLRREPAKGGWSYTSLADRTLGVQNFQQDGVFEPAGLSRVAFTDGVGSLESAEGQHLSDLAGPPGASGLCPGGASLEAAGSTGCYIELARGAKVTGASQNLEHVVVEPESVTPAVCSDGTLCEWAGGYQTLPDGEVLAQLKPVDVNEEGEVIPCGASLGAGLFGTGGGSGYHAVSAAGSTVLFSAVTGAECKGAPQLYARIDGTRTVQLSEPEAGVDEPGQLGGHPKQYPAQYVGASADDSRVFFATETWLTEDHPTGHDLELYEWRAQHTEGAAGPCASPEGCLTRVSVPVLADGEPDSPAGAGLNIALAVAANGSAVYFTADGVLSTNHTAGAHAEPGSCEHGSNGAGACALYRYQSATAGTPAQSAFIATIPVTTFSHPGSGEGSVTPKPRKTPAYTTPDGRYLLFQNGGNNSAGGPLYRYDSETGSLVSIAEGSFYRSALEEPSVGPVRGMSDDGSYVFFDTSEQLAPQAKNQEGEHPTLDTYEWHENTETHAQSISLIGSGTSEAPTYFLGYAPNPAAHSEQAREAGNVFIGTHAQLSTQDTSGLGNVYDARACEPDSPCIEPPPVGTRQCEDGGCQNPPTLPLFQTPATNTLSSSGNIAPEPPPALKVTKKTTPKCKKGEVKKKVKKKEVCVKRAKKSAHKSAKGSK